MAFTSPDLQLTALSILTAKSAGESLYQIPAPSIFLSFRSQKRQWAKFLLKDLVDCNKLNLSVTRSTDTVVVKVKTKRQHIYVIFIAEFHDMCHAS